MSENPDRVIPDEVIGPGGERGRIRARGTLMEAALVLPNLVKLVARLVRDQRVPVRAKVALAAAAAYVVSPIDLVPEFIPVIGWADDILIIMFALDTLIQKSGHELVVEHWDGPQDILSLVTEVVSLSRNIIPRRLGFLFNRISG
jgi:uncharacterized membrane protein YkvA (DUF1232 family)